MTPLYTFLYWFWVVVFICLFSNFNRLVWLEDEKAHLFIFFIRVIVMSFELFAFTC